MRRKEKKRPEGVEPSRRDDSTWTVVGGLPQLSAGGTLLKEISGEPVLFLKLGDDFYAYRHLCPGCGESLEKGDLDGAELSCPECERRYDVRRAGRCLDDPQLHLEPIPLLVSEEVVQERQEPGRRSMVKIALPSAVG